jgi:UDP-glucose 4-epimerase
MTNVLCTGGAGFMGSHVAEVLANSEKFDSVVVLDDLSGGFIHNIPSHPSIVQIVGPNCSLYDHEALEYIFKQYKFDYVFHLAAYAAEGLSHFIRRYNYQNNLINSVNLINLCIRYNIKCILFTSSIAVYGHPVVRGIMKHYKMNGGELMYDDKHVNVRPFNEDMNPHPVDPYGIAKYAVELDLAAAHDMFGLNYIIFRPHNVYGIRQNVMDKYRNVIGIFMRQIVEGKPITIFGDGNQTRCFTYINDIRNIISESIFNRNMYNEVFNIGSDIHISLNELATIIKDVMGVKDHEIIHLDARNEVEHAISDHGKIIATQEYIPTWTPIEIGLQEVAKWVKTVKLEPTNGFTNIEVDKNMPQSWRK